MIRYFYCGTCKDTFISEKNEHTVRCECGSFAGEISKEEVNMAQNTQNKNTNTDINVKVSITPVVLFIGLCLVAALLLSRKSTTHTHFYKEGS